MYVLRWHLCVGYTPAMMPAPAPSAPAKGLPPRKNELPRLTPIPNRYSSVFCHTNRTASAQSTQAKHGQAESRCRCGRGEPSQSRCRCGRGEPGQSRCRCGRGEPGQSRCRCGTSEPSQQRWSVVRTRVHLRLSSCAVPTLVVVGVGARGLGGLGRWLGVQPASTLSREWSSSPTSRTPPSAVPREPSTRPARHRKGCDAMPAGLSIPPALQAGLG